VDGTQFGRYRLVELLGRGGMGEVWRAFDTAIDRVVALKVLPANFADDEVFQTRFRREARAAAGLDEPHVVPIHDFGEIEGRLYVTMRLIKGRDLQQLLAESPLPPARAVGIIEQIASALNAAHEIGLVHRDVKPSNILITNDDFAYLIDFGIARAAGDTGLTSTGATIGTWAYMAPERFQKGTADARSDVYALACVLHESLTGQPPFPVNTLEQIAVAHMLQTPPRPSELRDGVPARMDQVIATGMAKDPDQRYATAKDLAQAARAALTTPVQTPTLSTPSATTESATAPTELAAQPQIVQHAMPSASEHAVAVNSPKRPLTWAVIAVPLVLALLLVGAGAFAVTQVLRRDPQPSTAAPQWQPYVDYAKQFTVLLTSLSPQTADSDIQRILDASTGSFHDEFARDRAGFEQTVVSSNATTQGAVNSAGLESISGTTAYALVAATSKITNNAGASQQPRSWRLRVRVEKVGDTYKVSNVEFVP
jgi:serine/threonine protein kinase, bacterial